MSETTGPVPDQNPTEVTEPLQLADQRPVAPAPVVVAPRKNHTRTILEVVGAAVAVVLIFAAAGVGFAIGHVTGSNNHGRDDLRNFSQSAPNFNNNRGNGGGMMGGNGFGQQGQQGQRGVDPDGDNWTGGGMMGGNGFGQQGQGVDPRGIDPDGDNWTGGGTQNAPAPATPGTPAAPSTAPSASPSGA